MPIAGQYRYRDLLQLIPAKPEDPRPSFVSGLYGGTLAVSFDDRVAPERPEDRWAHDHRERARIAYLTSKVDAGKDSQEWLQAVKQTQQNFSRRKAIENEAVRLLQVLTNSTLQRPQVSGHNWYLDPESGKAVFGQNTSPSFVTEEWGAFWAGAADPIRWNQCEPRCLRGPRCALGEQAAVILDSHRIESIGRQLICAT
jgi:hypothetical protein